MILGGSTDSREPRVSSGPLSLFKHSMSVKVIGPTLLPFSLTFLREVSVALQLRRLLLEADFGEATSLRVPPADPLRLRPSGMVSKGRG